eukprot:2681443-Pyramimonas_sp.AAC.1
MDLSWVPPGVSLVGFRPLPQDSPQRPDGFPLLWSERSFPRDACAFPGGLATSLRRSWCTPAPVPMEHFKGTLLSRWTPFSCRRVPPPAGAPTL